MPPHLLLVDDDTLLRRSLAFSLEQNGYKISTAASAEDGIALAEQSRPDLVILDIGLPGMDGLQALRRFQDQLHIPVIFLTARRRDLDEILGLELGAEDYLTKPFNNDVLLAHVKAVLRRVNAESNTGERTATSAGDLSVDPIAHRVTQAGRPVELTPREFELLYALVQNAGRVMSVDELLARVWGAEFNGQPQVVYVHIRWLREKLEADPQNPCRILTVRGVGYKLEPQPES